MAESPVRHEARNTWAECHGRHAVLCRSRKSEGARCIDGNARLRHMHPTATTQDRRSQGRAWDGQVRGHGRHARNARTVPGRLHGTTPRARRTPPGPRSPTPSALRPFGAIFLNSAWRARVAQAPATPPPQVAPARPPAHLPEPLHEDALVSTAVQIAALEFSPQVYHAQLAQPPPVFRLRTGDSRPTQGRRFSLPGR